MSARLACGMAALAVAQKAIVGDLDQIEVDACLTQVQQLLPSDDALYRAVTGFATQYEIVSFDPGGLALQGRLLRDAIEAAVGETRREPRYRADIDG